MMNERMRQTLFKTSMIGFAGGFVVGLWLYFSIMRNAAERMQQMDGMSRASYDCAAGSVAALAAFFSPPAGAIFGLCLGAFLLWRKSVALDRPLP